MILDLKQLILNAQANYDYDAQRYSHLKDHIERELEKEKVMLEKTLARNPAYSGYSFWQQEKDKHINAINLSLRKLTALKALDQDTLDKIAFIAEIISEQVVDKKEEEKCCRCR